MGFCIQFEHAYVQGLTAWLQRKLLKSHHKGMIRTAGGSASLEAT